MSWWDAKQFTSIASNAIKNAQKKIDKVLDIPTEDDGSKAVGGESSSWSAWSSPSFLPSTPKKTTFDESTNAYSTPFTSQPSSRLSEPTAFTSPVLSAPSPSIDVQPLPAADSLDTPKDKGQNEVAIIDESPTPAQEKKERRRATRQRASDKPPTTKKLGAVKLGAVKVQRTEAPSPIIPSTSLDSQVPQAKPDDVSMPLSDVVEPNDKVEQLPPADTVKPPPADMVEPSPADTVEPPSADTVKPPPADMVEPPPADTVEPPPANTVEPPPADTVELPPADTVEPPPADTVEPPPADTVKPPPAETYNSQPAVAEETVTQLAPVQSDTKEQVESVDSHFAVESSPAVNEPTPADMSVAIASLTPTDECNTTLQTVDNEKTTSAPPHTEGSQDLSTDLFSKSIDSDLVYVGPSVSSEADVISPRVEETQTAAVDESAIDVSALDESAVGREGVSKSGSEATLSHTTSELITNSTSSEGTVIDQEAVECGVFAEAGGSSAPDHVSLVAIDKHGEATPDSSSPSLMEQSTCSDNSYVKCELPVQPHGRAPSEFSLPSMHDFETATSSDIEIISMASTYGDGNGEGRMMDFVPLSRGVFKTKIRDVSPDDGLAAVSPQQLSPNSDKDSSDKSDSSSSRKESENSVNSTMIKKVSQLTEVLEARENKLLAMSREHSELLEVNALLKRRIEQMEETNGDLDLVKGEFGQRLHDLERKLQSALREKELVKKEYMSAQEELQNRAGMSGKMQRMVEEKDEQISSLMAEGQALAKQQLTSNNLIKKLRKKEKEQDELTRDQREKIASLNSDLERLKLVLDSKVQNETKHTELIKQLNSAVAKYQAETSKLKSDADEALDKQKRAESAVDNSYKEIAELHKSVAAKDAEIKELKIENAAQMREELQIALDKKQKEALRDADHLTSQIEDMQLTISRMEKEQNRREECLRQEKQDLLERLEEADKRSDDMTQSVTAATKPLLRQIENLQSSYSAQSISWERVEKNLTDRLTEAQTRLAAAVEKERVASEGFIDASSQVNVLESQLLSLKQDRSKLMAEVEVSKMKISTLQDERNSAITQLETYRSNIEADKLEAKKSLTLLENKLDLERNKLEVEKKKCLSLMEQLNDKDQQIHDMSASRLSTPSPVDDGRTSSIVKRSLKQDELLERALSTSSMTGSTLYDSMRNHSSTSLLESLESQVKQREGEITQLQADILEHEKTRESLTKEMLKLTEQNSKQEARIKELSRIQHQYKELNARYQALLQMYGEKEEAVNELRMDLIDVKQMYKQQIDALLSQ